MADWNPKLYARFSDLRLRPALDLLMQVPTLPDGDVIDLGCGNGPVGPALRSRFPDRRIIGVDTSPAMLEKAKATGAYDALQEGDIATWRPEVAPALIFSNAALHWLPDHEALLPRLAGLLADGGVLAVQVPHQNPAVSHRSWHDLVALHFPGRFDPATAPGIPDAAMTFDILSEIGAVQMWETEYFQLLPPADTAHPVRLFTSSTYARPVLDVLEPAEQAELLKHYDRAMDKAYPRRPDGSVLFPFRRLFYTVTPEN